MISVTIVNLGIDQREGDVGNNIAEFPCDAMLQEFRGLDSLFRENRNGGSSKREKGKESMSDRKFIQGHTVMQAKREKTLLY